MSRMTGGTLEKGARAEAVNILGRIEEGTDTDPLLEHSLIGWPQRERAFITELVYGVLRHRGRLDWIICQAAHREISEIDPPLRTILRVGSYQSLFLSGVPSYAVVNESVNLAKRYAKRGGEGFVNAVLRTVTRSGEKVLYPDIRSDPVSSIATQYSHPSWMVKRWISRFGIEKTIALCKANNEIPPLTLRTNTLRAKREELVASLKEEGVSASLSSLSPDGVICEGGSVRGFSAYEKGWFYVQDEGAQLISYLLTPHPGEVILDCCAAPGGKLTHLAQIMRDKGLLVALDLVPERLVLLKENCSRLGITGITPLCRDASTDLGGISPVAGFDRILVDAPCSALGTLRRNLDGKWRKTEDSINGSVRRALAILENVSHHLKSGGILIYSTCSTEEEENEQVVEEFLTRHPEFVRENVTGYLPPPATLCITSRGDFSTLWNQYKMDLFFAARLRKGPRA